MRCSWEKSSTTSRAETGCAVMSGLAVLCLLILQTGAHGFGIGFFGGNSVSHLEITERAILNTTLQVCRAMALTEGKDFNFPPFTPESVAVACQASKSYESFRQTIYLIQKRNWRVDIRHLLNPNYHFDNEKFYEARKIITEGLSAVKASNKQQNFETAREKLGQILHTLQDFYSHSNWVEMDNKLPNSNLIRSDTSIGNIAAENRATCRSCDGDNCMNNILEDILQEKILTSGYFAIWPFFSSKPKGKCSHGGGFDQTSGIYPKGGINKDEFSSSHGHLHREAANLAIAATSELLEDIRGAAGDKQFLQMMGIYTEGSSKALCLVTDTTESMSDEIEAVRNITSSIINGEVGTGDEPSVYILVPFNDPEFGPLTRTTDPKVFNTVINSLSASGGGDEAELSLSGLQLALAGAPSNSKIFLFTDAPAKDKHLKSTVTALIEWTKTVVNFVISSSTVLNRRRQRDNNQQQHSRITASDAQLYRDLVQASGGLAIEVTNTELPEAISIITESSRSSLVTLLQAARSPGKVDNFAFIVDETVINLTVYITGRSVTFTLISPTGESQQSSDTTGSLITESTSVGNLKTLRLKKLAGLWEMKMVSTNPYTLKVIGQSPINFLFDFVKASPGPFAGFDALDTRPRAGVNGSLFVSLMGSDSAKLTEVTLVESSGSEEIKGVVEPQERGNFLVHVDRIPSVEFVVQVKGQDDTGALSIFFQRQSSTNFRGSNLTIIADSNSILVPGTPFSLPFSVMTNGKGGNFTIRATNNRRFDSIYPTSLFLEPGISTNATVTLSVPLNTLSGTDVILIIEAEAPGGEDTNYVVLRFSIVDTVTDFTRPVCQQLSLKSNCSEKCSLFMWEISVRVTDVGEGTGVERVSLRQGNGTMKTSLVAGNENITLVTYSASCCEPKMELVVVDRVGNVGSCVFSVSTKVTQSPLLCLSVVVLGLYILTEL